MINIKRFFIIGISVILIGLTACSNEDEPTNIENGIPEGENEPKEEPDNEVEPEPEKEPDKKEEDGSEGSFSDIINIQNDGSITALVNKYNGLADTYVPEDLVTVSVPTVLENPEVRQMRQVAADALFDMFEKAKESDVYLHARSGYRSYQTQVHLFNNYMEKHGEEAANRYSAKPGYSEHQTGLVMDVTSESVNLQLSESFGETKEGKWLGENAHKFGFIIRYLKDKEDITGYIYEPWHIRYLGTEVATAVYESGLTYEEFLVEKGIILEVNSEKVN